MFFVLTRIFPVISLFTVFGLTILSSTTVAQTPAVAVPSLRPPMQMIKDIDSGSGSSYPDNMTVVGNKIFFSATESSTGRELWSSNLTASGTNLIFDAWPGSSGSTGMSRRLGNNLLYIANDGSNQNLYLTDGTSAGTVLLASFANLEMLSEEIDGVIYMAAGTSATGSELYRTDGTLAGTYLVKEIWAGPVSGRPSGMVELPNNPGKFVFTSSLLPALWVSDGTTAGTVQISTVTLGRMFTRYKGELYFTGRTSAHGDQLWKTDGTAAGTQRITNQPTGFIGLNQQRMIVFNDYLYFTANDGVSGGELWKSDGTATGTQLVADLYPGAASSSPSQYVDFGSRKFYFSANHPTFGRELWESDGTANGTHVVFDLNVSGDSMPLSPAYIHPVLSMQRVRNRLAFQAYTPSTGYELYRMGDGGNAISMQVGSGCGTANQVPRCTATDPILGTNVTITCEGIPPGSSATLYLGFSADFPARISSQCEVYFDVTQSYFVLDSWTQSGTGAHISSLPLPMNQMLRGMRLTAQLAIVPPQATNFNLSEGVEMIVGY